MCRSVALRMMELGWALRCRYPSRYMAQASCARTVQHVHSHLTPLGCQNLLIWLQQRALSSEQQGGAHDLSMCCHPRNAQHSQPHRSKNTTVGFNNVMCLDLGNPRIVQSETLVAAVVVNG